MTTHVTERRLSAVEMHDLKRSLQSQRRDLERQMRRASLDLRRMRTTSDVSDPDVQPALMAALRALDSAEREAIGVSSALAQLAAGHAGR
jgi:hypothetical protein